MAYETSNPPRLAVAGVSGGPNIWIYADGDAATSVRVAGYFTNGYDLGMRANDIVFLTNTSSFAGHAFIVNSASASGGVDLTDGQALGDGTDSD